MIAALKRVVRLLLPAPVHAALTRHRRLRFTKPYSQWSDARAASTGYDATAILERMTTAARAVAAGRAAYERDTVLFSSPAADPLLLDVLNTLAVGRSRLRVLDFGGAFGSTWYQHRSFFGSLPSIEWRIVEQPQIAARGRAEFTTPTLTFHDSLDSALAGGSPDLVMLSSVLQYLEDPWPTLTRLAALPAQAWFIARTPFGEALADDVIVVQHVPPSIYPASYPSWIFSPARFTAFWAARSATLSWHVSADGDFSAGRIAFSFHTALVRPSCRPA